VLKGDSTDLPLLKLLQSLEKGENGEKENIPNLTWRKNGKIKENPISYVPDTFDYVIDPKFMLKLIIREKDIDFVLPYKSWIDYPAMTILTSKGCIYNCVNCGGSSYCYQKIYNRKKPAFMKVESIIEQPSLNEKYIKAPVFF